MRRTVRNRECERWSGERVVVGMEKERMMDSFKDVVRPDPQGPIYHKECYRISQKQREME